MIGLGSPTQHTVDVVGVYFPAVAAALTVIPVYFIGKELFGRWAGVIAAGLLSVLPGEFLGRSILGFTDNHVIEVLFTATAMMFLIMAVKTSRERQLAFSHLWHWDWATISRPLIYSLLAGIFLGIYQISWDGALLFAFVIAVYFVIQFVIDHLSGQPTDHLCLVGVAVFLVALIITAPVIHKASSLVSLGIGVLIPVVLAVVSRQMASRGMKPAYYLLALLGLAGVGLVILRFAAPSLWATMWEGFYIFNPSGPITIVEMQPLFTPGGRFTTLLVWNMFAVSFYISLVSIIYLAYSFVKQGSADKGVLVVWSLVILAATLGQRRFAYYFAVNVAVLTGYASWLFLRFVSLLTDYLSGTERFANLKQVLAGLEGTEPVAIQPVEIRPARKKKKARARKRQAGTVDPMTRYINISVAVVVVFFLVFFPNVLQAKIVAEQVPYAPTDAWRSSLEWLSENTPEPFGDPDHYYQLYKPVPVPESAYAVTAWGDYGYWILRLAHRPVNQGPGPGGESIAQLFLSSDENQAQAIAKKLKTSYVVIDYSTTVGKFYALAEWAGQDRTQFYDYYFIPQEGDRLVRSALFYPDYYRTLAVRMYNFDGQAVTPKALSVISYDEVELPDGGLVKVVTSVNNFASYEEAIDYVQKQKKENYRIVSENPFISPVPLEAVEGYSLIHSSDEVKEIPGIGNLIPEVKIFEYTGR